jgi:hypothetical protein
MTSSSDPKSLTSSFPAVAVSSTNGNVPTITSPPGILQTKPNLVAIQSHLNSLIQNKPSSQSEKYEKLESFRLFYKDLLQENYHSKQGTKQTQSATKIKQEISLEQTKAQSPVVSSQNQQKLPSVLSSSRTPPTLPDNSSSLSPSFFTISTAPSATTLLPATSVTLKTESPQRPFLSSHSLNLGSSALSSKGSPSTISPSLQTTAATGTPLATVPNVFPSSSLSSIFMTPLSTTSPSPTPAISTPSFFTTTPMKAKKIEEWTLREHAILQRAFVKFGLSFNEIATYLPNKNANIIKRYYKSLGGAKGLFRPFLLAHKRLKKANALGSFSMTLSPEEEEALRHGRLHPIVPEQTPQPSSITATTVTSPQTVTSQRDAQPPPDNKTNELEQFSPEERQQIIRHKVDIILFANSRDVFYASDINHLYQQGLNAKKRRLPSDWLTTKSTKKAKIAHTLLSISNPPPKFELPPKKTTVSSNESVLTTAAPLSHSSSSSPSTLPLQSLSQNEKPKTMTSISEVTGSFKSMAPSLTLSIEKRGHNIRDQHPQHFFAANCFFPSRLFPPLRKSQKLFVFGASKSHIRQRNGWSERFCVTPRIIQIKLPSFHFEISTSHEKTFVANNSGLTSSTVQSPFKSERKLQLIPKSSPRPQSPIQNIVNKASLNVSRRTPHSFSSSLPSSSTSAASPISSLSSISSSTFHSLHSFISSFDFDDKMTQKWGQFLSPFLVIKTLFSRSHRTSRANVNIVNQSSDFHPPFHCLSLSCNCIYLSVNNDGIITGIEIVAGQYSKPSTTQSTTSASTSTLSLTNLNEQESGCDTQLKLSIKTEKYYFNGESFSSFFSAYLRQRVSASSSSGIGRGQQYRWEDISLFSPDSVMDLSLDNGDFLALSQQNEISIFDLTPQGQGREITRLHGHPHKITALQFSQHGHLASGDQKGIIRVWSSDVIRRFKLGVTRTDKFVSVTSTYSHSFKDVSAVSQLCWSPLGDLLFSYNTKIIKVWDVRTGNTRPRFIIDCSSEGIATIALKPPKDPQIEKTSRYLVTCTLNSTTLSPHMSASFSSRSATKPLANIHNKQETEFEGSTNTNSIAATSLTMLCCYDILRDRHTSVKLPLPDDKPLCKLLFHPIVPSILFGLQAYRSRPILYIFHVDSTSSATESAMKPTISIVRTLAYHHTLENFVPIEEIADSETDICPLFISGTLQINSHGTLLIVSLLPEEDDQNSKILVLNLIGLDLYTALNPTRTV